MTLAEVERYLESRLRVREDEERRRANFDYILADLIGRSVSRVYNSSNKMPHIYDAYPSLFNKELLQQQEQERKAMAFAANLRQFALQHNAKITEASTDNE